jgi:hypothetical protein
MSPAHAVAPVVGAEAPYRGLAQGVRPLAPRPARRPVRPSADCYLERALLLWPRLDRAKIRKVAHNPVRIAEIVERRTSQPFDAILAMLTKHAPTLTGPTEQSTGLNVTRPETGPMTLRIVRSEEGGEIQVQDLLPD